MKMLKTLKYQTKQQLLDIVLVNADHVRTAECTVLLRTRVNTTQSPLTIPVSFHSISNFFIHTFTHTRYTSNL